MVPSCVALIKFSHPYTALGMAPSGLLPGGLPNPGAHFLTSHLSPFSHLLTVFITRDLGPGSPFRALLEAAGWKVSGLSLVRLTPLPLPELPAADWIFFASGQAVRFFFEQLRLQSRPLPAVRWAAIGPPTAAALMGFTGRVDFTGTGDPAATAATFRALAAGQRVLFPAARQSVRSVPSLLADAIRPLFLDLYENVPLPDPPHRTDDVLVFTSPLNARAYFQRHPLQPHQQLVAIGQTTAATLRRLGMDRLTVSEEPSETVLARTVLNLGN
jgi:uroporphyrinogen-III synthase